MNYPLCFEGYELFFQLSRFLCYNKWNAQPVILRHMVKGGTKCRAWAIGITKIGKAAATGNRCVLCFGRFCDPLPIPGVGIGSGWPLGGPSVAQGPPKRRPREAQASIWGSVFVCNENKKVAGGGGLSRLKAQAEGREDRRDRASSPTSP